MRVRMKGINRVSKRLSDGSRVTYYYAWKGGPRLPGKPGDPEFVAAYNEAVAQKAKQPSGTLQAILNAYQESPKFTDLAERTRKDYAKHIRKIEAEYGDFPISALIDRRTRGEFLAWRDRLAISSRRQADYTYSVLALTLAWGFDRGLVACNPCERPGKTYRSKRVESVWSSEDEATFLKHAPERIHLAYMLAVWTGQRQGDLLKLTWNAYDGETIRIRQSKTGARVQIYVGKPLKELLDQTKRVSVTILSNTRKQPWTSDGFRTEWDKVKRKACIEGLTFHDLRGTAVTRLAMAGCTTPEIATITGHSLKEVEAILDAHYLNRDSSLGISAIRKLEMHERRTKIPN